jgi:transcriptional regulator GlxA family with amidase domain
VGVVPIFHAEAAVRAGLRRGLRPVQMRVVACRSLSRVERVLQEQLVNAVVLDVREGALGWAAELIERYPRIPVFAYSAFRPEDGRLLTACAATGFRAVLVDGIDDAVAGDVIASRSAAAERQALLADAPQRLRLSEPLQLRAWEQVLARVGSPTATADVAQALGMSREHLSREFAAGGAPNLKRVIDLVRGVWAAHLLTNPGYTVDTAARILGFSSSSHLTSCARRIAGVSASGLAGLGSREVLNRFLGGRTRSRL